MSRECSNYTMNATRIERSKSLNSTLIHFSIFWNIIVYTGVKMKRFIFTPV